MAKRFSFKSHSAGKVVALLESFKSALKEPELEASRLERTNKSATPFISSFVTLSTLYL